MCSARYIRLRAIFKCLLFVSTIALFGIQLSSKFYLHSNRAPIRQAAHFTPAYGHDALGSERQDKRHFTIEKRYHKPDPTADQPDQAEWPAPREAFRINHIHPAAVTVWADVLPRCLRGPPAIISPFFLLNRHMVAYFDQAPGVNA